MCNDIQIRSGPCAGTAGPAAADRACSSSTRSQSTISRPAACSCQTKRQRPGGTGISTSRSCAINSSSQPSTCCFCKGSAGEQGNAAAGPPQHPPRQYGQDHGCSRTTRGQSSRCKRADRGGSWCRAFWPSRSPRIGCRLYRNSQQQPASRLCRLRRRCKVLFPVHMALQRSMCLLRCASNRNELADAGGVQCRLRSLLTGLRCPSVTRLLHIARK